MPETGHNVLRGFKASDETDADAPSSTSITSALHALAPQLVIWECDLLVYRAGWLQAGIVGPGQLGTVCYIYETPDDLKYRAYWELIWAGKIACWLSR
mgnify:CR=1 FL=1